MLNDDGALQTCVRSNLANRLLKRLQNDGSAGLLVTVNGIDIGLNSRNRIDECGAANFFGIKNNTYITPKSSSILPSITNKSLMQLAEDMGIKVECRPVPEEELETFEEAGACGTAAVISPIQRIDDLENNKSYVISKDGKPGPICTKLYTKLRAIQYGDEPDTHNWVTILD